MITSIGKILISTAMKLITPAMIEWVIMECAEMLAKRTDTKFDDKLVARLKEELSKR